ncbi:cyclodeaminase/cyclohydrolase family protein [Algoriphagus resistens]|uniref:cyclodeaminase/cyclohydrolase family protein n=1 Tax=Algoriphagus resistens TaxID=1750590 RepID=UPI000716BD00|nr:cyclodeaminase/cyclohydrolase family protein [Algoriphagus resistens]
MNIDLDKISVDELLKKFGAGEHIPGSGSAAAMQVLISANLIITVIKITLDPNRKPKFESVRGTMLELKKRIEENYIPQLKQLFHQDYQVFDAVILNRKDRNLNRKSSEEGTAQKFIKAKSRVAQDTFLATQSALEISKVAIELAKAGIYVFQHGYKAVGGDSAVGIQGSLAMAIGSLHIAELNLKSLVEHEDFRNLELELEKIRSDYWKASANANKILQKLQKEIEKKRKACEKIKTILAKAEEENIEKTVRALQLELYSEAENKDFSSVIDAEKALRFLGYDVIPVDSLGAFDDYDGNVEAAGEVDNIKKVVRISTKYPPWVQKFTMTHELGHAILHYKSLTVLHRDRALESGVVHIKRSQIEVQADKFAALFLMPRKEMLKQFEVRFGSVRLHINQDISFALSGTGLIELKKKYSDRRRLSRFLASTTLFGGVSFASLTEQFNVSMEAMAIRIEELDLVDYNSLGY